MLNYQNQNKKHQWSVKRCCRLLAAFVTAKACADGCVLTRPSGDVRENPCPQQMSLGRSWKKSSKQGRRSRGQAPEVTFTHTFKKKIT